MNKLRTRLSLIFIIFSMGIIFIISSVSNNLIKENFNKYLEESIDNKKNEIYRSINNLYINNNYDLNSIENIGMNALENGLIIKITDEVNESVWDARTHNNGMCESIIENVASNMNKINPGFKGEYKEDRLQIKDGEKVLANLTIGYYGPFYYSDSDVLLLKTLNDILFIVALVALLISILIGVLISTSLSKPIFKIIESTNSIAKGNYKNRIENSSIEEINGMINSVNKLAETLDNQEKMRKIMTKDIAHELRTPLSTIQGQLEALIDGIWETSELRLKSILDEINRLTRLIGSLDRLSQYEYDGLELNNEKVRVDELLKVISTNFHKSFIDKNLKINLNLRECYVSADKDRLSQAIINILSNSIKYSNVGGYINIACEDIVTDVKIIIVDNGIGIAKEHLPFIFERFYRTDTSRTRDTGGAGIGLTITKAIVMAHGGEIFVTSEINKGCTFIIKIPKGEL